MHVHTHVCTTVTTTMVGAVYTEKRAFSEFGHKLFAYNIETYIAHVHVQSTHVHVYTLCIYIASFPSSLHSHTTAT